MLTVWEPKGLGKVPGWSFKIQHRAYCRRSPVRGAFCAALPGLRLQEVADGVGVGEELSVGVEGHSIHPSSTPADL